MLAIQINLAANTANFSRNLDRASKKSKQVGKDIENSFANAAQKSKQQLDQLNASANQLSGFGQKISGMVGKATAAAAAIGSVGAGVGAFIRVQREFDVLNASLITATGSAQNAAAAMDQLKKFAKETPYGLNQAVEGFVKLKNLGLNPSIDSLTSFGNTASASGKDLMQMIEAVADATTFEFERLKEFGIKANQQGNQVAFTFQGVTTTVGKNAKEIEKYLLDIGNVKFAGAMAEQMNTLHGAMSSFQDSWDGFLLAVGNYQIGEISIMEAIKKGVQAADAALSWASENLHVVLTGLGVALLTFGRTAIATAVSSAATWTVNMARTAAANVAAATSTQRLGNVMMSLLSGTTPAQIAMHRYSVAVSAATATTVGFVRAIPAKIAGLRTATAAIIAKTRATLTLAGAQKALIASTVTAGRGVLGIGTALASVGRIIMAHPLMIIGGIIAAIAVRTMGLQKAMDSLSDALKIVGMMLGDLVDMGIDGFMSLYNSASTFLSGFLTQSDGTTSVVGQLFGGLFANTRGGFVGMLQVVARVFDRIYAVIAGTIKTAYNAFRTFWAKLENGFWSVAKAVSDTFSPLLTSISTKVNDLFAGVENLASKAGIEISIGRMNTDWSIKAPPKNSGNYGSLDIADNIRNSYGGFEKGFLEYADKVAAAGKATQNMGQQGAAAAAALADAAKAGNGRAKADKDGAKAGKEKADADDIAAEAAKELAEAYENATKEFKKNQWMREHNRNDSETGKMTYEVLYGDMAKLPIELKRDLIMAASQEDANKAYAEIQKSWHDHYESLETTGSNISRFLAQTRNEYNTLNSLGGSYSLNPENPKESWHILHTPEYQQALSLIAEMDVSQVAHEMGNANIELQKQLDLLSAGNDYARSLLEIEQKQNETLEQYNALKELAPDEHKQIQTAIETNTELQKRLTTATAYQAIVDEMTTEEEKQLAMARERFAVIAEQQRLAAANGDALHPNVNRVNVLNEMIGLGVQPSQNQFSQAQAAFEQKQALIDAFVTESRAKWQGHEDELTRISEEADNARIALRRAHFESMLEMSLSYASEQLSAAADFAKSSFGEQSKAYQVMFSLQKAVTISQASLAMYQAISKAMADGVTPAQRATEIATAMAQGLKIIAAIRSITNPVVGQAHDGISRVPREGTWILDKGERVVKPRDNDRLTKFLDNPNRFMRGEPKVIINNYSGEPATATQENGDLIVTIGKMVGDAIDYKLAERDAKAHRQGWGY